MACYFPAPPVPEGFPKHHGAASLVPESVAPDIRVPDTSLFTGHPGPAQLCADHVRVTWWRKKSRVMER